MKTTFLLALSSVSILALPGCSFVTSTGPSGGRISNANGTAVAGSNILVVDVTSTVVKQILSGDSAELFSENLGDGGPAGSIIGRGDVLDIAIWEAPPAALFGATAGGSGELMQVSNQVARGTTMPEQMVENDGRIRIPFAGSIQADGRTVQQIGQDIQQKLTGIAHQPQVIVRLVRNATRNVTVVGDVANSARVPLTAKGERLLDVLAAAGGVKQPVNKTMIQITRGPRVASLALEKIIRDPRQNIRLQSDDVVTAFFQPFSFTALGASGGINSEISFEGTGITLAQALGRVGGLNDQRANASGVFIFRFEEPAAIDQALATNAPKSPEGKIPVIYRIDLKNPASFFLAQSFPVRNKDILYISNAPMAEVQKFVNIISSVVIPVITVQNATKN